MTGMALLCYLGHCELQDSPDYGPTVQKAINFITSTTPEPKITQKTARSKTHFFAIFVLFRFPRGRVRLEKIGPGTHFGIIFGM